MYIKIGNEVHYKNKVIGKISSTEDKIEILTLLVLKIRDEILKCNINMITSNIPIAIGSKNGIQDERKVFFANSIITNNYIGIFKYDIELNANGDLKFDMMMLRHGGYDKDWYLYCK